MVQRRLSRAQENPVTAIDIALEPNAAMVQRAEADNARLLKAYPGGFARPLSPGYSHSDLHRRSRHGRATCGATRPAMTLSAR
jgi:hypothetical protein